MVSHCGKVLGFPQFSGSAPAPEPPGTRPFAEEESASALLPRSFRFLKKEMKFLLTNEKLRSSSSAGKNGKAPRPVFLAKRYRLAWKLRRRFRPLASDYTIFSSPQGKKSSCKHNYRTVDRNLFHVQYISNSIYSCQEHCLCFHILYIFPPLSSEIHTISLPALSKGVPSLLQIRTDSYIGRL